MAGAGADAKVALERGRPVVLVCPPAPERVTQLWELVSPGTPGHGPGVGLLILCADHAAAAEWQAVTPPALRVHAVTGLARSVRRLKSGSLPDVLTGTVADLAALVQQAALKLEQVECVVVAWPEALVHGEHAAVLDALLGEMRQARRVVLSWNPALLTDFLERHARRPLIVGTAPVDDTGAQLPPVGRARFCIVAAGRRAAAARDALDTLNPTAPLVWDGGRGGGPIPTPAQPVDAVVCTTLPSRDELAALARLAEPVVLITAAQLPYLRSIATLKPLSLPGGADRARDRAAQLRERITHVLATRGVDAELALLDPLFERWDPAEVAGALLALQEGGGTKQEVEVKEADAARVNVFINVGKKDRVAAKDLVGALIREAGVAKADIGRIEVRETFSLVDLAPAAAERAVRGLAGVTIRGRRVLARLDRER